MNKTKLTAAIAWIRRQPRAVLIPGALLLVIVLIAAIASMHHSSASTTAPRIAAAAPAGPKPAAQPVVPQTPAHAASAHSAAPVLTVSLPAAASTAKAHVTTTPIDPPAGVQPGFVKVAQEQQDQFDRWAQVSAHVEPAQSSSYTTTSEIN